MRYFRVIFMLAIGGLAAYLDFKPIKHFSILFFDDDDFLKWFFLFVTFVFTLAWLQRSIQLYRQENRIFHLITPLFGTVVIVAVLGHNIWHNSITKRNTVFDAYNYDIGSDGGLKFEFKEGGYILGRRFDRFSETYYFGRFHRNKDTLELSIPLDFPLSNQAYISGDSLLVFRDDPKKFYLDKSIFR